VVIRSSETAVRVTAVQEQSPSGTLTANGNVTFGASTTFNLELNGIPVAQYDRLTSSGTVTLGGANLTGSLGAGFTPPDGTPFTILQSTGTITGKFAQGDSINFGGQNFQITYNPNSVVLTATAAPSPTPTPTPTPTSTPTLPLPLHLHLHLHLHLP
jgi:outer membrane autotransporter protein